MTLSKVHRAKDCLRTPQNPKVPVSRRCQIFAQKTLAKSVFLFSSGDTRAPQARATAGLRYYYNPGWIKFKCCSSGLGTTKAGTSNDYIVASHMERTFVPHVNISSGVLSERSVR